MKIDRKRLTLLILFSFLILTFSIILIPKKVQGPSPAPPLTPSPAQGVSLAPGMSENPKIQAIKDQLNQIKGEILNSETGQSSLVPPDLSFGLGIKP